MNHHETLLVQASGSAELQESVAAVRRGLTDVTQSLEKCGGRNALGITYWLNPHRLRQKIRIPYQTLEGHVSRLQRLQLASEVLRRTARFVIVARRLEFQMSEFNKAKEDKTSNDNFKSPNIMDDEQEGEKERNLAKAALSIIELSEFLPSFYSLRSPNIL